MPRTATRRARTPAMLPSGFLAALNAEPWEQTHRLAFADWCQENGLALAEQQLRVGPPPLGLVFFGHGDGYGSGYGYGDGSGDGSGDGYGYGDGSGHGYGHGDGYGHGYGYGYGDGSGDGDGDGYGYGDGSGDSYGDGSGDGDGDGDGSKLTLEGGRIVPEVGQNQLIVLPHGWVICGFVAEQTGPYQFRVERASVIARTGGTPWDELADGKGRAGATFRTWGDVNLGPQFVMSRDWKGKLPCEK